MNEFSPQERKEMFEALKRLRDATNVRLVKASDILDLIQQKLNERKQQSGRSSQHWHNREPFQQRKETVESPHTSRQGQEIIKCAFCLGLGFEGSGGACSVCRGAKKVSVPIHSSKCGVCLGLGFSAGTSVCQACEGTGRVAIPTYHH